MICRGSAFERYNIVSEGGIQQAGRGLTGTIPGKLGHTQAIETKRMKMK